MSTHAESLPAGPRFAARFAAVRFEDCGPCAQLVVDMALAEGVDAALVRAVVARDLAALPPDVRLALEFAEQVVARAVSPALQQQVEQRFDARARVTLAYAIVSARSYPTIKRALGLAASCSRLVVNGETVATRAV
jgi:alkylhydroperoxidase family enzyme